MCDCYKDNYQCDQDCLEDSLADKELYYSTAMVCCSFIYMCIVYKRHIRFAGK